MCRGSQETGGLDKNCSILLVEDSAINQKLVQLMLRKYDIVPVIAESGSRAIEAISSGRFDIILMDLNMPGIDGIETAGRIRKQLGDHCPPIVALTADAVFKVDEKMARNGFKDLLVKPISQEGLVSCIQKHTTTH